MLYSSIANLANLRRRSVRDGTREFYDAVVIRAFEIATAPYLEANPGGGDQIAYDAQTTVVPAAVDPAIFALLRKFHRNRQYAMDARKRADLSLGALLRTQLGWSLNKPTEERNAIAEQAKELIATGERLLSWQSRDAERQRKHDEKQAGKVKPKDYEELAMPSGLDNPDFLEWEPVIMASLRSREPMSLTEEAAKDRMNELATHLPVAQWWRDNVFEGTLVSLATVIAETGDITDYGNVKDADGKPIGYHTIARVWKRMGVAVMDGVRQGGLLKTAPKAAWIAHGYVRRRRSLLYVIGEALIKGNDHYRAIYHAEKSRQRAKAQAAGLTVAPSAKIPEKRKAEFISDGHIANKSRRYMEKELLRDLWCAWNGRAKPPMTPSARLPSQPIADADEA